MKYLVFSDSHSSPKKIIEAIELHMPSVAGVIFLGDGASDIYYVKKKFEDIMFFCVKGNCDFACDYPKEALIDLDGIKVFITHGDKYAVKTNYGLVAKEAYCRGADAVLFGHTHIPLDTTVYFGEKRVQLFNPGSIKQTSSYGVINTSGKVLVTNHAKI